MEASKKVKFSFNGSSAPSKQLLFPGKKKLPLSSSTSTATTTTTADKRKIAFDHAVNDDKTSKKIRITSISDGSHVETSADKRQPLIIPVKSSRIQTTDNDTFTTSSINEETNTDVMQKQKAIPITTITTTTTGQKKFGLVLMNTTSSSTTAKKPMAKQSILQAAPVKDYENDIHSRPEHCSLEDYEKIPVEEFGAALMRGMGWKDGEGVGRDKDNIQVKDVELRPKNLGLGAQLPSDMPEILTGKKRRRNNNDKKQ